LGERIVGADLQIAKPDLHQVVELADKSIDMTPKAWSTFHRELIDETGRLRGALDRVREGQYGGELLHGVARSLHTIKGVAQVISLHQLIHCTHLLESLVEVAREDRGQWPHDAMQSYINWLSMLTGPTEIDDDDTGPITEFIARLSPTSDEGNRVTTAGRRLEAELNGLLTATVS